MTLTKTAESVTEGHPDKVCDLVSDALVDLYLGIDHEALVSIKALAARDIICLGGEVGGLHCQHTPLEETIRKTIEEIGYTNGDFGFNASTLKILDAIDRHPLHERNKLAWDKRDLLGSRDQGFVFGYACNETPEYLPLPLILAHNLARKLTELRKSKTLDYLGPDGKTQVTIAYDEKGKAQRAASVIVSALHAVDISPEQLTKDLEEKLLVPVLGTFFDKKTQVYINPTGRFVVGGPAIDTGLTGRKLMVDTYGDAARHGGGAFSGKDPTSADRCGAYLARYIAKNIIAAGLATQCEVEFSYAIGSYAPLHVNAEARGTGTISNPHLEELIQKVFHLTISDTITYLQLRRPIYKQTAAYGHFGRQEFPWERLDKVQELQETVKHV